MDFQKDVAPILESRCIACHGPDKQRGGLRLDGVEAIRKGGSSGEVIVPTNSAESSLIHHVLGSDETPRMPPKGDPLSAEQIGILRAWIDQQSGNAATSPEASIATSPNPVGWALQPLERPAVPQASNAYKDWARTPIDAFVLEKLLAKGLHPSPEASRPTLIRRLSFDLTGLPPTPEEIDRFVDDASPEAYERLVDRLLNSPRYGERWARHWLDVVHYADSHGQDQDRPRPNAWPYRDYLIRSFNADKLYPRFVREQLAGDVLYPGDADALVATGFLAAGPFDESSLVSIREDSIDRLIGQYLDRDDMVTSTMSTFAGMTVGCARCHDHKFDPITQDDYYALQAVFAGIDKADRAYDSDPAVTKQRADLAAQLTLVKSLAGKADQGAIPPQRRSEARAFVETWRATELRWETPEPIQWSAKQGSILKALLDRSILAVGKRPESDSYTIRLSTERTGLRGLRLDVLTDETLPSQGPGRAENGNLHLSEIRVKAYPKGKAESSTPVKLIAAQADFNQVDWGIERAIDGDPVTAWGIHPAVGRTHRAVFTFANPVGFAEGTVFEVELDQVHGRGHLIGRFRLALTGSSPPLTVEAPLEPALSAILTSRTPQSQESELARLLWERGIERELGSLPPQLKVYCGTNQYQPDGSFRPTAKPRPINVLARGEVSRPLKPASPGAVLALASLPGRFELAEPDQEGSRRASLANWLTSPSNPITWRVIANRVWHYHFGRGIVDTPNDLGKMGGVSSHPELLDWLAAEVRDRGSLKALHHLIVTSRVYRQSSASDPTAALKDADNRLLWRMNRNRLDAESVRDAILLVSGRLDERPFGAPDQHFLVKPGIHVTPEPDYDTFNLDQPDARRRSVYRYIFRTRPDPLLEALDCPDASQSAPARATSMSPLQALSLWNNKFTLRHAEHLAALASSWTPDAETQVVEISKRILGRSPSDVERKAWGEYSRSYGLANLCRVLLNSSEFLFID
ncbi:PSD1 and planctomycete cytochrome C domain-containing protein [Singulisphaera sp. PoT]|uniref:PSD1 and planctomycete cytochrome C domain-containing protein n=1 Tax=Singulisphaera sp. PoT TaxID=3411797 RepID=UPI003BF4A609